MPASNRLKKERLTYLTTLLPEGQGGAGAFSAFFCISCIFCVAAEGERKVGLGLGDDSAPQQALSHSLNQASSQNGSGKAFNSGYQLIFQD